jgi:hypothetical protein
MIPVLYRGTEPVAFVRIDSVFTTADASQYESEEERITALAREK